TLGTITGCFGGIIRDILLNRIPLILRKEIYATACIVGGSIFLMLAKFTTLSYTFVQISTILLIVLIRTLAVKYHWQMPKFYGTDQNSEM
ncbi:MAG TPA: TRIC cation channel family protein, partial [Kaistella sp.]|nr:TRIC cation channel family protein [Kaistella sp.]